MPIRIEMVFKALKNVYDNVHATLKTNKCFAKHNETPLPF